MDIVVPAVGESITEVGLSKQIVSEGGYVKKDQPVFEVESDKASLEVVAPQAGIVHYVAKQGDTLKIGAKVCTITPGEPPAKVSAPEQKPSEVVEKTKEPSKEINVAELGRMSKETAEQFLQTIAEKKKEQTEPAPEKPRDEQRREPITKLRKTIAKRLVQVKNETAMLTTFNEVDLSVIMAAREADKEAFQKQHGVKLTYLPYFVKAVISALKAFPNVNAFIDGDEIVYNAHQHVGIAVSTDTGLVVPVIKNADQLSFVEIAKTIQQLAGKARDRKLTVSDMAGGTFTITNGGVFGSMLSTPILNPPQSAILGMHNIVERPVVIQGEIKIRPIMYLALSYDHRIIDGKESVSFLVHIKKVLEQPVQLFYSS